MGTAAIVKSAAKYAFPGAHDISIAARPGFVMINTHFNN